MCLCYLVSVVVFPLNYCHLVYYYLIQWYACFLKNSLGFKYFLKPVHYLYFYCFAGGPADSAIEWCWTGGRSHYYSPQIGWPGQSKQMYQLLCVCVAWSQHYMLLFLLDEEYMCITASKRQLHTLIVPCSVFV